MLYIHGDGLVCMIKSRVWRGGFEAHMNCKLSMYCICGPGLYPASLCDRGAELRSTRLHFTSDTCLASEWPALDPLIVVRRRTRHLTAANGDEDDDDDAVRLIAEEM